METVLKTYDLTKKFKNKTAVDSVNMTVCKGDIYGFIGKNGAGKTTLLRLVSGLLFPDSGEIELFGEKANGNARKRIGSLIETPTFYANCTAYENMKRYAILFGADEAHIKELLDFVGLGNTENKKAGKFSLGMKQRLGIAIALLGDPEFIILDEPVNGLDPEGMKEVRDIILKLNREKGTTFLISSHLLDELSKIATKYGIINNGKLVEEIESSVLAKKCRQKLKISVDDPEKARELLLSEIPEEDISVSGGTITLLSHVDDGARFNKLLSKNDIAVSGIEIESEDLENYFIERIGGANNG
ncbi:MAG: ABC transporter ATP-binding protein [Eubacteriales bacterium]